MNDTNPPQRLEDIDPAVLAEIEAEFAAISTEIQRISALPASEAPKKPALLAALRADWKKKAGERDPNRPEWRKSLDEALDRAIDKLMADSIVELPDGQMAFQMNNQTLQSEAPPILKALLGGFTAMLQEKLKPQPGAAPSPFMPLLQSLGAMIQQAVSKMEMGKPAAPASDAAPTSEGAAAEPTPEAPKAQLELKKQDPNAPLGGDGIQIEVNVPLDAKLELSSKGNDEPNPAGQVFFQNLMSGLGQFLQTAFKPAAPTPAKPDEPKAEGADAAAAKPDEGPKADSPTTATVELKQTDAPAEAPKDGPQPTIKIDVEGLLKQLLGNIKGPPK